MIGERCSRDKKHLEGGSYSATPVSLTAFDNAEATRRIFFDLPHRLLAVLLVGISGFVAWHASQSDGGLPKAPRRLAVACASIDVYCTPSSVYYKLTYMEGAALC